MRVDVELEPEERAEHDAERALYLAFVAKNGIRMGSPRGFGEFVMRSRAEQEGRRAMRAYRRQRELAFAATAKLAYVEHLLDRHRDDRALALHAGQRDRVPRVAPVPRPRHHAPDQGDRAQRDPRGLRRAERTARS